MCDVNGDHLPWLYNNKELNEVPDGYQGFVYLITNKLSGKRYIGKKNFFFKQQKTIQKNGVKKKKSIKKESDWKSYYGSNDDLKNDVVLYGAEHFERVILHLCPSKALMGYLELREQIDHRVLEYSDKFYNKWISARITSNHIKNFSTNENNCCNSLSDGVYYICSDE